MSNDNSSSSNILTHLASLKIAVTCLLLFMVITVLGTLYQVDHGIGEARDMFFTSWIIMIKGILPFPGGQLILWIFAINLLSSCFVRFKFKLNKIGIWFVHIGLLCLCFSSFYTYQYSVEGNLRIAEGDTAEYATVSDKWELALWYEENGNRIVTSYSISEKNIKETYIHEQTKLQFVINNYIDNSEPILTKSDKQNIHNVSGIIDFEEKKSKLRGARSIPGVVLSVSPDNSDKIDILLYGAERYPTQIQKDGITLNFKLRPQRLKLPVKIELVDVVQQVYEGTQIAKNYESNVILHQNDSERKIRIFMNHPLSVESFTFYQSSYGKGMDGRETTTLSVVKNTGKFLPYIACIITGLGMLIHFMLTPLLASIFNPATTKGGKK